MLTMLLSAALVAYIVGIFLASLSTFYRVELARTAASAVFVAIFCARRR